MKDLGLHVIGAGIGESIAIELPTGGWGVVDCYAPVLDDPSSNPTLQFLKSRGVSSLEFLCLTHPHDDHYRGMSHLIDALDVKYFWRFGGLTTKDLAYILRYYEATSINLAASKKEDGDKADALSRLFDSVKRKKKAGKIAKVFELSDVTPLYPLPLDANSEFEIKSITPSSDMAIQYRDDLAKCLEKKPEHINFLPYQRHNDVSVALLIRYGNARVILCGDVEVKNWEDLPSILPDDQFATHIVKISHHGSSTGYTKSLWSKFAAHGRPLGIVTPFHKFGLPKEAALEHILQHCSVLLATCPLAPTSTASSGAGFSFETDIFLNSYLRVRPYSDCSASFGVCSVSIKRDGSYSYSCSGTGTPIMR